LNWIKLNPFELNTPEAQDSDGVQVRLLVPDYDVPLAVGASAREDGRFLEISFRYDDDERVQSVSAEFHLDSSVHLYLGKNSKRLYRIVLDMDGVRSDNTKAINIISNAINEIRSTRPDSSLSSRRSGNYDLANKVVEEKFKDLCVLASK
jgi:hypothetical protein